MNIKLRQVRDSSALPMPLELGVQQAIGITVDNYSGYWLKIGSGALFVPPYILGWASNFDGSTGGSINIIKATPASLVTNPASGQEGAIVATMYDAAVAPNPGMNIVSKPRQGAAFSMGAGLTAGTSTFFLAAFIPSVRILAAYMSGFVTVGTIGRFVLQVADNAGATARFGRMILSNPPAVSIMAEPNVDFIPIAPALDPASLPWRINILREDIAGGNTFFGEGIVFYEQ